MSTFSKYRDYLKRRHSSDESEEELVDEMSPFIEALALTLFIGLLITLLCVAFLNIQPYVVLADNLIRTVRIPAGIELLSQIPFVGGMVPTIKNLIGFGVVGVVLWVAYDQGGFKAFATVAIFLLTALLGGIQLAVGAFVWLVVQIFEVLWLVISMDQQALRGALRHSSVIEGAVGGKPPRNHKDRSIINKLRGIPYFFIRWSVTLALAAYAFDAVVGISVYPPASSLETFTNAMSIGDWSQIDMSNCIKLLLMMFSFEVLLILVLVVAQWLQSRKQGVEA